ncbi:hypothetical protein [Rugamonas rivuli]|uniref:Uncharacterized protein n=1 Tax=Rugamonas rivuli TaxID=2743358 RepID=A0A843SBR5_9BURK|nr:hypothetical protein [Rugamonas rivuli]MQA21669.1 hypothetical protein [Rugamonas rivuli]
MHPMIQKTFGGLTPSYYARHLFFGCIFLFLYLFVAVHGQSISFAGGFLAFLNTFLYPYARFAYEGVVGYIVGKNVFILPAGLMLLTKVITMTMCWFLAVFIAPVGLAYLYVYHSRRLR